MRYGVRTTAQRAWMLIGVLIIEAISWGIAISAFFPESASRASGADYWVPFAKATGFAALCMLGVHLLAFAFLAPLASYRPYDTFFLLVPLVAVVFWFRIVWRLTALPERYWPARDDELPDFPRRPADSEG